MKVYVAAPFGRYREALLVAKELERRGFEVTSSWLKAAEELGGVDLAEPSVAQEAWLQNTRDILRSDVALGLVWTGEGQEMFLELARAEQNHGLHDPLWVSMDGGKLPLTAVAHGMGFALPDAYKYLTSLKP